MLLTNTNNTSYKTLALVSCCPDHDNKRFRLKAQTEDGRPEKEWDSCRKKRDRAVSTLRCEGIDKVVRRPGAAQEELDGRLEVGLTGGSAKSFDGCARHEKVKRQEAVPARIRGFHLAADVEAGQGIPKLLHQQALVGGHSVQAEITFPPGGKVSSAGIAGNGFRRGRWCMALRSGCEIIEKNLDAHLPKTFEPVEQRAVIIVMRFKKPENCRAPSNWHP